MLPHALLPLHRVEPAIVLGSWAEWATASVALLALFAAVASAVYSKRQVKIAKDAFIADAIVRAEAQPRKVYSTPAGRDIARSGTLAIPYVKDFHVVDTTLTNRDEAGSPFWRTNVLQYRLTVHNASDEVIGGIYVSVVDEAEPGKSAAGYFPDALLPGTNRDFEVPVEIPLGYDLDGPGDDILPTLIPVIEFRDSAGKWWTRAGLFPIQAIDRGPFELP